MNRLEQLKVRVEHYKVDVERSRECCDVEDFSDDVLYLLSIIEQAEKALQTVVIGLSQMHVETDQASLKYAFDTMETATEALKAIRGE